MALGDYILCCKCGVKLIYDGDRRAREWWEERFDKPPEIECPDCKAPASKPLTDEQINLFINGRGEEGDDDYVEPTGDGFGLTDDDLVQLVRRVEAAHGIKGDA